MDEAKATLYNEEDASEGIKLEFISDDICPTTN